MIGNLSWSLGKIFCVKIIFEPEIYGAAKKASRPRPVLASQLFEKLIFLDFLSVYFCEVL